MEQNLTKERSELSWKHSGTIRRPKKFKRKASQSQIPTNSRKPMGHTHLVSITSSVHTRFSKRKAACTHMTVSPKTACDFARNLRKKRLTAPNPNKLVLKWRKTQQTQRKTKWIGRNQENKRLKVKKEVPTRRKTRKSPPAESPVLFYGKPLSW